MPTFWYKKSVIPKNLNLHPAELFFKFNNILLSLQKSNFDCIKHELTTYRGMLDSEIYWFDLGTDNYEL